MGLTFDNNISKEEIVFILRKEFDKDIYTSFVKRGNSLQKNAQRLGAFHKKQPVIIKEQRKSNAGQQFSIICKCTKDGYESSFNTEFDWRGHHFFADFSENGRVTVFSDHSIARYDERVLNYSGRSINDIYRNEIERHINHCFHIVLPSQTHFQSVYFAAANALFLGDYIESERARFIWMNTCLAQENLHTSQYKIFKSLGLLAELTRKLNFDPIRLEDDLSEHETRRFNSFLQKDNNIPLYKEYLRVKYLLSLLLLDVNFSFVPKELVDKMIEKTKSELCRLNVDISRYYPYDDDYGIVKKGEIDYDPIKVVYNAKNHQEIGK